MNPGARLDRKSQRSAGRKRALRTLLRGASSNWDAARTHSDSGISALVTGEMNRLRSCHGEVQSPDTKSCFLQENRASRRVWAKNRGCTRAKMGDSADEPAAPLIQHGLSKCPLFEVLNVHLRSSYRCGPGRTCHLLRVRLGGHPVATCRELTHLSDVASSPSMQHALPQGGFPEAADSQRKHGR